MLFENGDLDTPSGTEPTVDLETLPDEGEALGPLAPGQVATRSAAEIMSRRPPSGSSDGDSIGVGLAV